MTEEEYARQPCYDVTVFLAGRGIRSGRHDTINEQNNVVAFESFSQLSRLSCRADSAPPTQKKIFDSVVFSNLKSVYVKLN